MIFVQETKYIDWQHRGLLLTGPPRLHGDLLRSRARTNRGGGRSQLPACLAVPACLTPCLALSVRIRKGQRSPTSACASDVQSPSASLERRSCTDEACGRRRRRAGPVGVPSDPMMSWIVCKALLLWIKQFEMRKMIIAFSSTASMRQLELIEFDYISPPLTYGG